MASTLKVDKLEGSSGSTITVPTGQTLTLTDGLAVSSLPVVTVAKGGTNIASFAAGDLLYATGSTTLAKLPKGAAEKVLSINSGATAPEWTDLDISACPTITVAKGGTNLTSFTAGDILYATGATTIAKLAKGTTVQTLKMNSGATAPEWVTVAAGGNTPIVAAYHNTDQTIANNTWEVVELNTELTDSDSAFASNRFTVPSAKAGKYYISFTFQPTTGGTTTWKCQIRKNGSGFIESNFYTNAGAQQRSHTVNQIMDLSVSDYLEFWLHTDLGGGTHTINGSADKETRLNIFYLGA